MGEYLQGGREARGQGGERRCNNADGGPEPDDCGRIVEVMTQEDVSSWVITSIKAMLKGCREGQRWRHKENIKYWTGSEILREEQGRVGYFS